ncbi:unnamed protein product [Rotaria sordida]|uniref:Uncharacterized protein n=1 Tax=Rotaria sordida TaxID=392033 RepID=A0A819SCF6_9BILA|nr:unnamed protein product [Rotaria sordida]
MVFVNVSDLIEYVCKNIMTTMLHIDVIYDGINELKQIRHRFKFKCDKVEFCTIYDLLRRWEKVELNKALDSSGSIDQNTVDAILSIIKDRLHDKQLAMFNHFSSFLKQSLPSITDADELVNEEELIDTTYDNFSQLLCLQMHDNNIQQSN